MDVYLDDDAFVRAPIALVYERVVDLSSYPTWWPGMTLRRAAPAGERWDAEIDGEPHPLLGSPREPGASVCEWDVRLGLFRHLRLEMRPYGFRPGLGLFIDLAGDLEGKAEWWLERAHDGTVVHHIASADVTRRPRKRLADRYRASVRRGLWNFKDVLQSEIRERLGLAP